MRKVTGRATIAVLLTTTALISAPAMAQDAPDEADPTEIVVTAQKRSESLQNVPISIQAIGTQKLEQLKKIHQSFNRQRKAPGRNPPSQPHLSISPHRSTPTAQPESMGTSNPRIATLQPAQANRDSGGQLPHRQPQRAHHIEIGKERRIVDMDKKAARKDESAQEAQNGSGDGKAA